MKVTGRQSPRVSFGISIIYMTEDGIVVHGFGHAAVRLSRTDERMIGYNYETYACGVLTCVRAEKMVGTDLNLVLDTLHNGIQCCQPTRFDLLSASPPVCKNYSAIVNP